MAVVEPREKYDKIALKARLVYLRNHLLAGRERDEYYIRNRRKWFPRYREVHLAPEGTLNCYLCAKQPFTEWHHIVPLKRGGSDSRWNLVPMCCGCRKRVTRHTLIRSNRVEKPYVHVPVLLSPKTAVECIPAAQVQTGDRCTGQRRFGKKITPVTEKRNGLFTGVYAVNTQGNPVTMASTP